MGQRRRTYANREETPAKKMFDFAKKLSGERTVMNCDSQRQAFDDRVPFAEPFFSDSGRVCDGRSLLVIKGRAEVPLLASL